MPEPTSAEEAQRIVKRCVCSSCWGQLVAVKKGDLYLAECQTCNECRGYVSRKWTERRASESAAEKYEARAALRDSIPWMKSNKTEAELIESLGF